jgi:hypothetical protein
VRSTVSTPQSFILAAPVFDCRLLRITLSHDEDIKEIQKRTRQIEKYRIHLSHHGFFANTNKGDYTFIFNEDGGFIR